jgi:hypothetical protein
VTVDIIYPGGNSSKRQYAIAVNSKPARTEIARAAPAEQLARIGFLTNIDPDCSSTPFASVRIIEEPKYGQATLEEDAGFTNSPKENPRFECNKERTEGTPFSTAARPDIPAKTPWWWRCSTPTAAKAAYAIRST